jgi:cell division protein FtsQ
MGRSRKSSKGFWSGLLSVGLMLLVFALTVTSGIATYWLLKEQPYLVVKDVQVEGAERVGVAEIMEYAQVPMGEALYRVGVDALARAIARHPDIAAATVTRVPPDIIRIHVVEHVPLAAVALGQAVYLMSKEGKLFRRVQRGEALDLPVITGISRENYSADPERAEKLLRLAVEVLGAYGRTGRPGKEISAVDVNEALGATLMLGDPIMEVDLGYGMFEEKLRRLALVESHLRRKSQKAERVFLDNARHPERVALRIRPLAALAPEVAMRGADRRTH